jgi:hypothetical protein
MESRRRILWLGLETGFQTAILSFLLAYIFGAYVFEQQWAGNVYYGPLSFPTKRG